MTPEEEEKIEKWGMTVEGDVSLKLVLTKDKRSKAFQRFMGDFTRLCPTIRAHTEQEDESTAPEIQIDNIRYHAIPLGKELDPFLRIIGDREGYAKALSSSIQEQINQMQVPAFIKAFITPQCPFCPLAVDQLLSLAASTDIIKLTIIDGALFSEMAASEDVHTAPTVLLDDQFRWVGSIQTDEIVNIILNRDPSQLSESSLASMLSDGSALRVAEMMVESGRIYPAFTELLVHEKWPMRLGAMVAYEAVAAKNHHLLIHVIPFLWEKFLQANDTIKGDILYLYGQSKNKKVIPKLKSIAKGQYSDDVKEAALEALQELNPD